MEEVESLRYVKNHKCKNMGKHDAVELYCDEGGREVWFKITKTFMNRKKIKKCPYCNEKLSLKRNMKECIKGVGAVASVFIVIIGFIALLPETKTNEVNAAAWENAFQESYNLTTDTKTYLEDKESIPYKCEYGYDEQGKRIVKKTYYTKVVVVEKIDP